MLSITAAAYRAYLRYLLNYFTSFLLLCHFISQTWYVYRYFLRSVYSSVARGSFGPLEVVKTDCSMIVSAQQRQYERCMIFYNETFLAHG